MSRPRGRGLGSRKKYTQQPFKPKTVENFHVGDPIECEKGDDVRFYFQNVNGISAGGNLLKAEEIIIAWKAIGVDVYGWAETNVNYMHPLDPTTTLKSKIHKQNKTYSIETSSSGIETKNIHQPGGVATIVTGKLTGRIKKRYSDKLGRWSGYTICGKEKELTILTAYQVCKSTNPGSNTAAEQQKTKLLLREQGKTRKKSQLDPRKAFTNDLDEFLKDVKKENHEIMIMMDANESIHEKASKLRNIMAKHQLTDVHRMLNETGNEEDWRTYNRGTKKIDYIFGTPGVLDWTTKCGMEEFNARIQSDHRGLWIDVDLQSLLGGKIPDLIPPQQRGVTGKDPRTTRKFRQELHKYLIEHKFEERMSRIQQLTKENESTQKIEDLIQALDRDLERGMIASEKKAGKPTRPDWSPALIECQAKVNYYKCWLSEKLTGVKQEKQRRYYRRKAGKEFEPDDELHTPTKPTIQKKLRELQKERREIFQNAREERIKYLEKIAEERATGDKDAKKIAKIIDGILLSERRSKIHTKIKRVTKPEQRGKPIDHLLVRDPSCTEIDTKKQKYIEVRDPVEIMKLLLKRNCKHFSQATGTPFTIDPLLTVVGEDGTTAGADKILDGTYDIGSLDLPTEAARDLLKRLGEQFLPEGCELKDEDLMIDKTKVFGWFKHWKLRTSTSPSGMHLGLWKSAIGVVFPDKKDEISEDDPGPQKPTNNEEILGWVADYLELVRTTGVIPRRWQQTVNLMLEKIPGKPFLPKIRIIHILEADMNAFFGQQWCRDLQELAERHKLLGEEQWGSRKGRSAPEVALLKVVTYEMMHLTKTDGATFDNDAKACFDRIVRNIMMLVSRKLGMTKKACKTFVRFLLGMRFYQRTEAGISEEFFETFKNKLQGVGQGAKWSAIMWSQISPILMWLLEKKSGGLTFQDPLQRKTIRRSADGFVDDVTAWINCFQQIAEDPRAEDATSLPELITKMEEAAQYWEQLLNATGGKLELPKCFYYILHWNFDKEGEARLSRKEEIPYKIQLTESQSGEVCEIEQKDCQEAHKTLGNHVAPSLSSKKQFEVQMASSRQLATRLGSQRFDSLDCRIAITSHINPRFGYVGPTSMYSMKEAMDVQRPITHALLPMMRFNRHTPLPVVYAPIDAGGLGIPHFYSMQGATQVCFMMQHIMHRSPLGEILEMACHWYQKNVGTSFTALENPLPLLPHAPGRWISSLREFLRCANGTLRIEGLQGINIKRENDSVLMDTCLRRQFSETETRRINNVRIYLRVETLSDICNASGTHIHETVFQKTDKTIRPPDLNFKKGMSQSTSLWPRQAKPGPKSFEAWNSFLRQFHVPNHPRLRKPLGRWLSPKASMQERCWPHAYDPDTDMFFERITQGTCKYFENYESERRRVRVFGEGFIDEEPMVCVPVDKIAERMFSNYSNALGIPNSETIIETWEDYVSFLDEWDADLICEVECPSITAVAEALQQAETSIKIASDGGAAHGHGSYGWIICHSPEHVIARHKGTVRGYPIGSRRAEAYGGLSLARFIFHVLKYFNIRNFGETMRWFCDSRDVIKRYYDYSPLPWNHYSHKLQGDDDVIIQLHSAWMAIDELRGENSNGSPVQIIHVKSHQDDHKKYEKLNDAAKINYQCDQLATMQLQRMDKTSITPDVIDLPAARIYFTLDGQTITSQIRKQCLEAIPRKEFEDYLEKKFHWLHNGAFEYDWENFGVARRTARPGLQIFTTKLMFQLLPTAAREQKLNLRQCDKCKQCGEREDIKHLFLCYKRNEWLPNLSFAVNRYCHKHHTKRTVREYLKQLFNEFKKGKKHATTVCMELLCGLVRNSLVEAFGPLSDERNQWVRGLIRIFWDYAFKAWDQRNKIVHSKHSSQEGRERENVINSVKKLLEKSTEMSDAHRTSNFPADMDGFLTKSTILLQDWVLRNTEPIKIACEQYQQESVANTKQLEKYFTKKQFEAEDQHPLSDEDEDDEPTAPEGEFRRMLRTTRLLSYFPKVK